MLSHNASGFPKIISVDWRPHNRRAANLAADIGAQLFLPPNVLRRKALIFTLFRYIYLTFWTIFILFRERPDLILISTPPSFGPLIVFAYSKIFGCSYIIDAHHLATIGLWSKIPFGFSFNKFIMNESLITLVHNKEIKELTDKINIRSFILETRIPEFVSKEINDEIKGFSVMVPCSFDPDEPIDEIYRTASIVPDITFYLTGDISRLGKRFRNKRPDNITYTGFLSQAQYDALLNSVNAVLVLTDDNYPVRPRGASEAISAEKPLIVTRNPATQHDFCEGVVLIDNTAVEIAEAISLIQHHCSEYITLVKQIKQERLQKYKTDLKSFIELIHHNLGCEYCSSVQ